MRIWAIRAIRRVDIAVDAVEIGHLRGDPRGRQPFFGSGEMAEDMRQQPRVAVAHHLAEIGDLADFPQEPHRAAMAGELGHLAIAGERLQGAVVVGLAGLNEAGERRALVEALQERARPNRSAAWCCAN